VLLLTGRVNGEIESRHESEHESPSFLSKGTVRIFYTRKKCLEMLYRHTRHIRHTRHKLHMSEAVIGIPKVSSSVFGGGSGGCGVDVGDPIKAHIKKVSATLRQNYMMLGVALILTVIAIVGIMFMISHMMESLRMYYRYATSGSQGASRDYHEKHDDERYGSDLAKDNEFADESAPPPEYSAIRSKMENIKKVYGAYNREMSAHTRNVLNRDPDDLMDERILNRDRDDYDYGDGKR